ncbi:polysaccharide lyase 8 family protein [Arthrobacter sp. 35W]|uniref:polysaccharide lyase 8 family protein n=1 Tax=Arthrobacter sp. 35W TaxID=1132441 RepID=UPI0003F69C4E|nr:polysaccharide lyase 8 family protein [Arthrobacter sp. 35W]
MSRRTLFRTAGAAALASILMGTAAGTASAAPPLSAREMIARRRIVLTGSINAADVPELAGQLNQLTAAATASWQAMDTSAARTSLWSDISITGIGSAAVATDNMGLHFNRIFDLAMGHALPGTALSGNSALAADIISGLTLLSRTAYRPETKAAGNWWFWQIGVPRKVVDILTLMYDEVPAELRASLLAAVRWFTPNPNWRGRTTALAETGANRVDKALACCMRGILDGTTSDIALGRDALSDTVGGGKNSLFQRVSAGDGFYEDGSFVQHTALPYAGTYGVVALAGVAEIIGMLGGSEWIVTDPDRTILLDAVEKTFAPFIWDGRIMETIRGRAVSRMAAPDYVDGFGLISAVLLLAPGAGEPYGSRFLALAKGWLERCTDQSLVGHPSQRLARSLLALDVLNDASVVAAPAPIYSRMFADQDRLVHHRPEWGFTVSTTSSRIGRYEWGNNENNLGWYQGDGMAYLYTRADAAQFSANFWPTVDPYGLPGTTVNSEIRPSGASGAGTGIPRGYQPFAGGLTLAERFGVVGMDHLNHNKSLSGRKSWFFLDDAVVCLGAGITGTGGTEVHTTIENRSFATGAVPSLRVDHKRLSMAPGDSQEVRGSVHIDGHGGYVFLEVDGVRGTPVVSVVRRSGTWKAINSGTDTGGSDAVVERDYVAITHSHGTNPAGEGYAYMVLPAGSHSDTYKEAANPGTTVLANTAVCQMIQVKGEDLVLANFFAAGSAGGYTASGPCTVAIRETKAGLEIAVADPSRTQTSIRLELPQTKFSTVAAADPNVKLIGTKPLVLEVQLAGTRGHQQNATLGK